MSLRDAIKYLRAAAKRLDATTFNPQMNALAEFVDKLDTNGITATPPPDVRQRALEKFLRGDYDFSRRERRALPFIIYESAVSLDGAKKILRQLDFDNKRHISGLVNVYLNQYDTSAKTDLLRLLLNYGRLADNSTRLQKIFSMRKFLFGDNCLANTAKLFAERQSVAGVLEDLELAYSFKVSNFIKAALVTFYRTTDLATQLKILRELDADFDAYKNIFPAVADALIQAVARAGHGKELCLDVFYRRLGDPRFGFTRSNWNGVSARSVEIFSHWLSEDDLETFFKIVAATTDDAHWGYRERFWRRYLPRITNTWIFLTGNAKIYAAQSKVSHGTLTNGGGNQAVFVFRIGRYIFSEWSNVGKVRAYASSRWEEFFGRSQISGNFIKSKPVKAWIHSSPQTNFWQGKVGDWIARHC